VTKGEVIGAIFVKGTPFHPTQEPTQQPSQQPSSKPSTAIVQQSSSSIDEIFSTSTSSSSTAGYTASSLVKFTIRMTLENIDMVQFLSDDTAIEAVLGAVATATSIPESSLSLTHFSSSRTSQTVSAGSGIDIVVSAAVVLQASDASDTTAKHLYSVATTGLQAAISSGRFATELSELSTVFTTVSLSSTLDFSQPEVSVVGTSANDGVDGSILSAKSMNQGKGLSETFEKSSRGEHMESLGELEMDGNAELANVEKQHGQQEMEQLEKEGHSLIAKDINMSKVSYVQLVAALCTLVLVASLVVKAYRWNEERKKLTDDKRIADAIMHEREWDQEVDEEYNKFIPHGLRPVHIHRSTEFYRDSHLRNI